MENDTNVSNQGGKGDPNKSVMTMGDWLITFIIMMIPCVNLVMLFVWAFGNGNENRKNYCRACLIMSVIGIVLTIIMSVAFGAVFASMMSSMSY